MNGDEQDSGKETEQAMSRLSSSYASSSSSSLSSYKDGEEEEELDEFRPIPEPYRIPLSAFEPSFSTNEWSMISDAPPHETDSEIFSQNFDYINSSRPSISMQAPSTQPMDRSAGYDPDRIPSSVFSSKPAAGCEWSVASNDSLFSIHNFSFSRDEAIYLEKSEELGLVGEFSIPSGNPFAAFESKANEANNKPSSHLEPIAEAEHEHERSYSLALGIGESYKEEPSKLFDEIRPPRAENRRDNNQSIGTDASTSVRSGIISGVEGTGSSVTRFSGVSRDSGQSHNSFAFPVLGNEVGKSSSIAVPLSKNEKETTKKPETSWFSCSFSCFSFSSCISCIACTSCISCTSCFSCTSCTSCASCTSCFSCSSCFSCFKTWPRWGSCGPCCCK